MIDVSKLAILDFGVRRHNKPAALTAQQTLRDARLAETLGYGRYWLAEHQAFNDAWGNPTPMVGYLAAQTQRISIGVAGTLISFHDPFEVASDFRLLESLYPGRIDLGVAGGKPSMDGLRARHADRDYDDSVGELVGLLRMTPRDEVVDTPALIPLPVDVTIPMPWILGTGSRSTALAVRHRAAYCYSLFHTPRVDPAFIADYLERFDGTASCPTPRASIAVALICAPTDAEAEEIRRRQADVLVARKIVLNVVGNPQYCAARLASLCDEYGVQEAVVHDVSRTVRERRRGYALLAGALGAPGVDVPAAGASAASDDADDRAA